jgi:predicted AAA+ superfamily ATPase
MRINVCSKETRCETVENESIGKREMGFNIKRSQSQTKRAVVQKEKEEEEVLTGLFREITDLLHRKNDIPSCEKKLAKFPFGRLYSKHIQTNATNILATATRRMIHFTCAMNKIIK